MPGDSKAKLQREAERFVLQGKLPQAINEYLKIIKIDPEDILTLNTIGDLNLRLGKPKYASTYFSQVADHYARNNFILKAIAVYKKILSCDSQNFAVHKTLASLYTKQGLNVEARNEFLYIADACSREGKEAEAQLAYEKVADLDPSNASAQLKLADIHTRDGSREKAHLYLMAAAKAQSKAGDFSAALGSFERALEIQPADVRAMTGILDCSVRLGKVSHALEVLQKSIEAGHENSDLLEMLVKTYLAGDDIPNASATLKRLIALDETRYSLYFELQKKLLDQQNFDAAATCLDQIIPIVIDRRATKQAIESYQAILNAAPDNLQALIRLGEIYQASNDQKHYLEILASVCNCYLSSGLHREALEYVEKILQVTPDNEKYLLLHRGEFEKVYPGIPYTRPGLTDSAPYQEAPIPARGYDSPEPASAGAQVANPTLVEVDLLLTYGMREKAMDLLRTLKSQDPSDKEVRIRLLGLYKETNQASRAAEECLYLAQEFRKTGDEETAQKYVAEAGHLDSAVVAARPELLSYSALQGVVQEEPPSSPAALAADPVAGLEVDLSEDLSDIFFKGQPDAGGGEEAPTATVGDEDIIEEYAPPAAAPRTSVPLPEQLQEVDFYIRLGFYDEARLKLGELEKAHPGHPELRLRQRQIGEGAIQPAATPIALSGGSESIQVVSDDAALDQQAIPEDFKLIEEPEESVEAPPTPAIQEEPLLGKPPAPPVEFEPQSAASPSREEGAPAAPESRDTQAGMFADLLDEVNSLTDQEIAREEFETHFSLGIAYREMNLIDEAIREFQEAMKVLVPSKFPKEVIQCCGMLSTCFLEKEMPRSAIRWCETGLAIPEISPHESMALRYDMGVALAALGEPEKALDFFITIHGTDPSYRDVTHKIEELRGDSGRHVT
jgi:tetratricopeptide (TPR) repeat protein